MDRLEISGLLILLTVMSATAFGQFLNTNREIALGFGLLTIALVMLVSVTCIKPFRCPYLKRKCKKTSQH